MGTIRWEETDEDSEYISSLERLAKMYRLSTECQQYGYKKGFCYFCVEKGAMWIGKEDAKRCVEAYFVDASKILKEKGIECETETQFLPA